MSDAPHSTVEPAAKTVTKVSLLVAFDIGQTFVFKSTQSSNDDVATEWGGVFGGDHEHAKDWCTAQWEDFSKPMGWIATWRYFGGSAKSELQSAMDQLRRSVPGTIEEEDTDALRAIIFPNGIGVFILRIRPKPTWDIPTIEAFLEDETVRVQRRRAFCDIIKWAAECYLGYMHAARPLLENGARAVTAIGAIERKHGAQRAAYAYPIYFLDEPRYKEWRRTQADSATPFGDTELSLTWGLCGVKLGATDHRFDLERDFAIGLAGWYALAVMTNRSTLYIRDALHALSSNKANPTAANARIIRLAYTEAASQALPIQWTSRESDLFLLEAIHECWISERWWRIVEQKTNLLAAHWEQEAGASNDRWNRKITAFGVAIAFITLSSAVADFIQLTVEPPGIDSKNLNGLDRLLIDARVWLGFGPFLLGLIFVTLVLRGRYGNSRPNGDPDR